MINPSRLSLRLKSYDSDGFVSSIMYIRWSLDPYTTLLKRFYCLDGMITVLRKHEMHQSPFIMYKVSDNIDQKNILDDNLIRIQDIEDANKLDEIVTKLRNRKEASRLIDFINKHYPHLFI